MNNKLLLIGVGALVLGLLGGYSFSNSESSETTSYGTGVQNRYGYGNNMQAQNGEVNRGNCLADDCLLVDDVEYPVGELPDEVVDALNEAIQDEYRALATYESVIAKFGSTRPFSMIRGAEEQHIASLRALFDKYGIEVPVNSYSGKVTAPATLQIACQTGVDAEIANASLYKDTLLPMVSDYPDITLVFTNLMNASESKHLPAFERCN